MKRLVLSVGLITISLLLVVATAQAAAPSATFTTQTYPFLGNNHIAADFNGDGKLDLAGTGANVAAVMLNNGDGTFRSQVSFPVGGWPQDLAAGDFSGDGRMDLVVTINTPQIGLSLLTGNGNGTFNAPVNFANTSGFDSPSIVATDLNNDGKLDLVISHEIACYTAPCRVARTISVMIGNGNDTFQPPREIEVGTGMSRIAVGDFNRDGIKDLAICGDNTQLYTLLGVGDGTFVQQPTIMLVPGGDLVSAASDVEIADFNRDTLQDLAVALPGNGRGTAILIGNGDGTFGQPFRILASAIDAPQQLGVADFNIDGFQDIARALGDGDLGLMDILHGNGDGTFQPPVQYLVPPPGSSQGGGALISGDFNTDSKPDIALAAIGASIALDVSINSTGAPPPSTPTRTVTSTRTPTRTRTPTPGPTFTLTRTPTRTPTVPAQSATPTRTPTSGPSLTPTFTPVPGTTVTAFPGSTTILAGTLRGGTAASLNADDNLYYEVNSTTSGTRTTEWYGSFTGVSNGLSNLRITYKGKNSNNATQTVAIWRWTDSTWVQLDSRSVATSEVLIADLAPGGTLADYVSGTSGDGELRVRVRATRNFGSFFTSGDLLKIVYNRP